MSESGIYQMVLKIVFMDDCLKIMSPDVEQSLSWLQIATKKAPRFPGYGLFVAC